MQSDEELGGAAETDRYMPAALDAAARHLGLGLDQEATTGTDVANRAAFEAGLALAQAFGGAYPFFWDRRQPRPITTDALRALFGLAPDAPLSATALAAALHPDDRARVLRAQSAIMAQGGAYEIEFRLQRADGSIRWVLARGRTLAGADGRVWGVAGVNLDITDRKHAELALAAREAELGASQARLLAILNTMPQKVWAARPDGHSDFYNDRWYDYSGMARGETDGDQWLAIIHPDDKARARDIWYHSVRTGEPYEIEYRLRRHDGTYRWMLARGVPIRAADGAIERWYGTCTDIQALKVAEDQLEMVAGELAHRIRNIFAVINGMLMLSARSEPEAQPFADAARARIESLALAHDYIRPQGLNSAPSARSTTMHGLLAALLAPYHPAGHREGPNERISTDGPDIGIGTAAATSLALVIHELATNAAKHGALAAEAGTLKISTSLDQGTYRLVWTEMGGATVHGPPDRRGFGTTLSERALRVPLGARLDRAWEPTGLVVRIAMPCDKLCQ